MITAALLDTGLEFDSLKKQILSLKLPELRDIRLLAVSRCGIRAKKFEPIIEDECISACHGHHGTHDHNHSHSHHDRPDDQCNSEQARHHHHRNLSDIL